MCNLTFVSSGGLFFSAIQKKSELCLHMVTSVKMETGRKKEGQKEAVRDKGNERAKDVERLKNRWRCKQTY